MADEVGEIRQRVDIVSLVEESGIKLKKTGKNFVGLCPFHPDKNPSMTVNPVIGRYKCFSCGASGDVFNWVMNIQHIEFKEALKILADKAGIQIKHVRASGSNKEAKATAEIRIELMELAANFYQAELKSQKAILEYCESRSLDETTRAKWKIGYSPEFNEALTTSIKKSGFQLSMASDLYLTVGDDRNGYKDRFSQRLMFPIRNEKGNTVAFGGRIIGQGLPKYLNSSDTPLFSKSSILYGLFEGRNAIAKNRHIILTEGYMDVIACHRTGFDFAVASLGTSLTEIQAQVIKRWANRVTIVYDGDSAGIKAAKRASEILENAGLSVRIALMPFGEDPDSICSKEGPQAFETLLKSAIGPIDFELKSLEEELGTSEGEFWTRAIELLAGCKTEISLLGAIDALASKYPGTADVVAARRALKSDIDSFRRKSRSTVMPKRKSISQLEDSPAISTDKIKIDLKLNPLEASLLAMYLEDFQRNEIHRFLMTEDVLMTAAACTCVDELRSEFGDQAPSGVASNWIHDLPTFADVSVHLNSVRLGKSSEEHLRHIMNSLQMKARERKAYETDGDSKVRLQEILNTYRESKKDPRNESNNDEI